MDEERSEKIYACSLRDFLDFEGLDKKEFTIEGVFCSKITSRDTMENLTLLNYKDLQKEMDEKGYFAVTDVRIEQVGVSGKDQNSYISTIYGTALKRK